MSCSTLHMPALLIIIKRSIVAAIACAVITVNIGQTTGFCSSCSACAVA